MKRIKYIIIIILILLVLFILPNLLIKSDNEFDAENKMIEEYYVVLDKMIASDINEVIIKDNKYKINEESFSTDVVTEGKIYYYNEMNYGNLKSKEICLSKNYNSTVFKDECIENLPLLKTSELDSDYLVDDTLENVINDTNLLSSKKYYTGENPNNYLVVENTCYRIVNITKNDSLKIVYESPLVDGKCHSDNNTGHIGIYGLDNDRYSNNNWNENIDLANYFTFFEDDMYIDNDSVDIKLNEELMVKTNWNVGEVNENNSLNEDISDEQSLLSTEELYLGLLNNSDYLKVNCNLSSINADSSCSENNYLYKEKYEWYTMNQSNSDPQPFLMDFDEGEDQKEWWFISKDGLTRPTDLLTPFSFYYGAVRMSFFVENDIELIGLGTEEVPYYIVNY